MIRTESLVSEFKPTKIISSLISSQTLHLDTHTHTHIDSFSWKPNVASSFCPSECVWVGVCECLQPAGLLVLRTLCITNRCHCLQGFRISSSTVPVEGEKLEGRSRENRRAEVQSESLFGHVSIRKTV